MQALRRTLWFAVDVAVLAGQEARKVEPLVVGYDPALVEQHRQLLPQTVLLRARVSERTLVIGRDTIAHV